MSTLHRSYTFWWLIAIPGALAAYFMAWPSWVLASFLAVGAVVEFIAVRRSKPGDTLSEHLWTTTRDKPAMVPMALGFGVWLIWAPLTLFPAGETVVRAVGFDLGLWAIAVGVLAWLVVHFAFGGKYG